MSIDGKMVHISWFLESQEEFDIAELFTDLIGTVPESIRINQVPSSSDPHRGLAETATEAHRIILAVGSGRLDLMFQPVGTGSSAYRQFIDVEKSLYDAKKKILAAKKLPPAFRVSCVAETLNLAKSRRDARKYFSEVVGLDSEIDDSIDEYFRINRRTKFSDCDINRVIQISVLELKTLKIGFDSVSTSSPSSALSVQFALSMLYDFNTVPDGNLIEFDHQKKIFIDMISSVSDSIQGQNLDFLRSN